MNKDKKREYLTPTEAAELLLVSPVTVRQLAQKGDLPAKITPGGHRRFFIQDIENYARSKGIQIGGLNESDGQLKILIVDDDKQVRTLLVELFKAKVSESIVETASDGFEAGLKVFEFKPDVVILDFMMPGLNGIEVCRNIRNNKNHKHAKIIVITGYYSEENVNAIKEAGADACLAKPIKFDVLFEMLIPDKEKDIQS